MFIWDFVADKILGQIVDWFYSQVVGFLGNFFSEMGSMGAELFEMNWVQSVVLFFSYLGWALFATGLVVAVFECGIEYSAGRGNVKETVLNVLKGFLAVSLFTQVPVRLYSLAISLQGTSCLETVVGFTAGTLLGTAIAVAMWWWEKLARVLDPYLVVLNALPKTALGPIFIVWMGAGMGAIIVMTLAISLIVTILTMYQGFMTTDPEKLRLMRSLGARRSQMLWLLVFPANCPTLFNTLKVNVGLSWVGVIMGEFLVSRAGLGYLIVYGSQVFNMDLVMTSVLILALAAVVMYQLVLRVEKILNRTWGVQS